jgi:hypothetical protein
MRKACKVHGARAAICALGLLAGVGLLPTSARALTLPLTFEFDDGIAGDYGSVRVEENGSGGIFFEITLGPDLGPNADLHYFYFNLISGVPDLAITSDDAVATAYALETDLSVRGGAGSSFDYSVFFGNGAGPPGNGTLQTASFTLFSSSTDLSLSDLFELSNTSQGLEASFAAHVQSTSTPANSETIGAVIPEPTSFALMACGLVGLAVAGRRRA